MNNLDDNKVTIEVEVTITRDESDIATCEICGRELNYKYDRICDLCYVESRRRERNSIWLVMIVIFFFFALLGIM